MPKPSSNALEIAVGKLVGSGDDQSQRAELCRGTAPGVDVQERRRGEQDGRPIPLDELADDSRFLGFDMADQPHSAARSQPKQQIAERVEERQDVEDAVVRVDVENLADGLDLGIDVEVGENRPLGVALAAAAEDHRNGIIDRDPPGRSHDLLEQPDRCQAGQHQGCSPIRAAESVVRISSIQIASTPSGSSRLAFSTKFRLVTSVRSPAWAAAELIAALPAVKLRLTTTRPESDAARFTRTPPTLGRQHDSHGILPLPAGSQGAGQGDHSRQRLDARELAADQIGNRESERMPPRLADELLVQRPAILLAVVPGTLIQLRDRLADLRGRGRRGERSYRTRRSREAVFAPATSASAWG